MLSLLLATLLTQATMSPTSDLSTNRVRATGAAGARSLRDHLRTLPDVSWDAVTASSVLVRARGTTHPRGEDERWADRINVLDFGADPTGAADSTVAIQAAIDSMHGRVRDLSLSDVSPGSELVFPSGTYLISQPLLVTRSNSILRGAGSHSTIIKYSGAASIAEVIRFKDATHCELSYMKLDGGMATTAPFGDASHGARAGLGIDLAPFFVSRDLYIEHTTRYGVRIANGWESFWENLYIRRTGRWSTAAAPGAAIAFTDVEALSTVFPSTPGSNNTTFVKPTLVPFGGLVRTDVYAENIHFVSPITETDLYDQLPAGDYLNEPQWHIAASTQNFTVDGGYFGANEITTTTTASLIHCQQYPSANIAFRDYRIVARNAHPGSYYHRLGGNLFTIGADSPVRLEVTVVDDKSTLAPLFAIGGYGWTVPVVGSVIYRNDGTTPKKKANLFTSSASERFFHGEVIIQNGYGYSSTMATMQPAIVRAGYSVATADALVSMASTTIKYNTSEYDTAGAVSGAGGWSFTAPSDGAYRVTAQGSASDTCNAYLSVFVNGVEVKRGPNYAVPAGGAVFAMSTVVVLSAGDRLDIREFVNQAGLTLLPSAIYNWISIERSPGS